MSHKIRSLVLVALLIVLVTGPAVALPMGARISTPQVPLVIPGLWDWFSSLVTGFWEKEGGSMDPNGPPASGDAGGTMDPDGLNATGCPTEAGSHMDPDGKPLVCQQVVG